MTACQAVYSVLMRDDGASVTKYMPIMRGIWDADAGRKAHSPFTVKEPLISPMPIKIPPMQHLQIYQVNAASEQGEWLRQRKRLPTSVLKVIDRLGQSILPGNSERDTH